MVLLLRRHFVGRDAGIEPRYLFLCLNLRLACDDVLAGDGCLGSRDVGLGASADLVKTAERREPRFW